eukprot:12889025-Prorocentrum_lima.AAC.1
MCTSVQEHCHVLLQHVQHVSKQQWQQWARQAVIRHGSHAYKWIKLAGKLSTPHPGPLPIHMQYGQHLQ